MKISFSQLMDKVPVPFFRQYNIFSGTNDWTEWNSILIDYLKGRFNYCDSQLISNYEKAFSEKVGISLSKIY